MRKAILCVTILFLAVPPLAAQDDQTASFVYEAYYSVAGSEMEDWNRQYREYSVPVLTALVEEGLIEGFGQQRHHTGGDDYNIRFVVRTYDGASTSRDSGTRPRRPSGPPAAAASRSTGMRSGTSRKSSSGKHKAPMCRTCTLHRTS